MSKMFMKCDETLEMLLWDVEEEPASELERNY